MTTAPIWKSRPVFITSTFQDMQAERDHLRKFVFPALEEWLLTKRRHPSSKGGRYPRLADCFE
jgi:hypothetical protein